MASEDDPGRVREVQPKSSEAARIAEHLGGKRVGVDTYYADCLVCGYEAALAITYVGSQTLFYCHAGCGNLPVFGAVRNLGLLDPHVRSSGTLPKQLRKTPKASRVQERPAMVRELWAKSVVLTSSLGEAYLRNRAITIDIPASLRFLVKPTISPRARRFLASWQA